MYHPSYDYDLALLNKYAKSGQLDIVDYGCGNGILLELLPNDRIRSYRGYEVSQAALEVAHATYETPQRQFFSIQAGRVPKLGSPNSRDLIILIGVLQYMSPAEIDQLLSEARRVLRKGGVVIASCVTDHAWYRFSNLYQFILPNHYLNRGQLMAKAQKSGLDVVFAQERGLVLGPLFSHGLVIFFDALDKLIFRNKGKLGPIGIAARQFFKPIMAWEYRLPIDFGYTLFLVLKKK